MKVKQVIAAYFSPTGNVQKLAEAMARTAASCLSVPVAALPFSAPQVRKQVFSIDPDTVLILGLPVYAGRLPNKILPFVREGWKGNHTISLPFVAYGNRAFDDGLSELVLEQTRAGFVPAGAAAFPTQHAFASNLAPGRPDASDLLRAGEFMEQVCARIKACPDSAAFQKPVVPGNTPPGPYYKPKRADGTPAIFLKAKPKTDGNRCNRCGICAQVCPMGSIAAEDAAQVPGICIKCQACITHCPTGAKYFDDPDFLSHKQMLEQQFTARKEPDFYLF